MSKATNTVTLWRPVGPQELTLIKASGMREFPPRLPDQPIFYPVLTEAYAVQIARDWNVQASGSGFVTRFEVLKSFLDGYRVEHAGSRAHLEYWIPAEDLPQFNKAIVGEIVVTAAFGKITESTT
ncbi:ADP-ribosylation/crystallin J1 [Mesorhizobium sp. CA18]|uniref:ADP-ribosylation/crystallin J1 n=1 Tax=unclassified Mesorhizobium TaxID=325217 RepID=UPI001CCA9988|nr:MULTISPECIES: ADP-ribosylation/crystallin J1 [unclassified Mesorhizobium]MBZ9733816.1 ADP-ribosylation/crystallin J1 [Mesorhizobium sp. CA9]MBZ9825490.1 ADP-ribosylation/crystallin J1 [Mesorhizobium sp. CA18]MBZ9831914.1 ADP-ribosylation/crystallin J1 [Mesorhizobium sp. CA2]MBZ9836913.1 ADP-ribosylation/crystallin J1 [Mesorhizobium sp. CA3]MBZ9843495.1 ADP-ribosylation/crystallin J1 [Mesorhizobium sp. CA5]